MSNSQSTENALTFEYFQQIITELPVDNCYGSRAWKDVLDQAAPGWQTLVIDPVNHQALLQCSPKSDRDDLMLLFVETAGMNLADAWIILRDQDAKTAAAQWIESNFKQFSQLSNAAKEMIVNEYNNDGLIRKMTADLWCYLSPEKRQEILDFIWAGWKKRSHAAITAAFWLYLRGATVAEAQKLIEETNAIFGHWDDFDDCEWLWMFYRQMQEAEIEHPMPLAQAMRYQFQLPNLQDEPTVVHKIAGLIQIIRESNDAQSLDHWERQRLQYATMTATLPNFMTSNTMLVQGIPKIVKSWLQSKQNILSPGATLPPWPNVVFSDDDPPLFKIHPFYKRMYEEDYLGSTWNRTQERERHREHGPERIRIETGHADIELLLGCYYCDKKQIVLWRKGIELCAVGLVDANGKRLSISHLSLCVLIHELGHWFNAEAISPRGIAWDSAPLTLNATTRQEAGGPLDSDDFGQSSSSTLTGDARSLSSTAYHEVWAQLFAWLYGQEQNPGVLKVFEVLERIQSAPYQAWRHLVNEHPNPGPGPYRLSDLRWSQHRILDSLQWSRSLRDPATGAAKPATFNDAHFTDTNMLDWLDD